MSTLERAIEIAAFAHAGLIDLGGEPYVMHVLRVIVGSPAGDGRIVAALHDVVEDSPQTLVSLRAEGFSEPVLAAVDALTRRSGEPYAAMIERIAASPLARAVKLADLADNLDVGRLKRPMTTEDVERVARYQAARARLIEVLAAEEAAAAPPPEQEGVPAVVDGEMGVPDPSEIGDEDEPSG